MGSTVMDKWFGIDPPKAPALPPVQPPIPLPTREGVETFRRKKKGAAQRGQAGTVLAQGELIPMDVGKRSLLG